MGFRKFGPVDRGVQKYKEKSKSQSGAIIKTQFMKILMVCLGNICRSPLAEGILQHKIDKNNLDWEVDSAGTGSWHIGKLPDARSIEVAQKHGIDITKQRARQFSVKDFEDFDLIFVMDSSNYQNVMRLAPNERMKTKVAMIMNMSNPRMNEAVPDPYWDDDGFERVFQMLDEATDSILKKYR